MQAKCPPITFAAEGASLISAAKHLIRMDIRN
nr:MAG TPA: hypothetical protein [Caudoviricetes sp.]